jgi:hypothetical protein
LNRLASPFSTRLIMSLRTVCSQRLSTPHTSRIRTETTVSRPPSRCLCTCQSRQVLPNLPNLHTLILFAAFLTLVGVVPAASASCVRRPSLLNDASLNAAAAQTHGFLPAKSLLFLSKMSSADLTTGAGRPAAGLYVVLWRPPLHPHRRPPRAAAAGVRRRQRRVTSTDNYGRKLKPTAKKTRKTRQKTKKTLKNSSKKRHEKLQNKGGNNGGGRVAGAGHARDNARLNCRLSTHKVH